jgi:predicted transcriptional regulator
LLKQKILYSNALDRGGLGVVVCTKLAKHPLATHPIKGIFISHLAMLNTHSTTIIHPVRKALGISPAEYCLIDTVMKLANNRASIVPGWYYGSKQELADDMEVTRQGLIKMLNRLEQEGLIERHPKGYIRHTQKWYDSAVTNRDFIVNQSGVNKVDSVNKVYSECKQSLQASVNKVYSECKQSLPSKEQENITIEIKEKNITIEKAEFPIFDEFQNFEGLSGLAIKAKPTESFEGLQDQPLKAKKTVKSRTAPRAAGFSEADVAQHLESKEQQFFAQVLANGAWGDYLQHRKELDRFTYKSAQSAAQGVRSLIEATNGNADAAQSVVNQSRGKGWKGLFALKQPTKIQQNVQSIANSPSFAGAFT